MLSAQLSTFSFVLTCQELDEKTNGGIMRFWSIDMHISIQHDVADVFSKLGHTVDKLCLSNHTWVNGESPGSNTVINQGNFWGITQEVCDKFYDAYKDQLKSYDGFLVSYPPLFALLFEKFNKPVICVACTRYDFPTKNHPDWNKWLNDGLMRGIEQGRIIPVANNKFDQKYCETYCGGTWRHIPGCCDYMTTKWSGRSDAPWRRWARPSLDGNWPRWLTRNGRIDQRFNNNEKYDRNSAAHAGGVIHIPYNVSIMSAFEHCAMGIPMIVPSTRLLKEWRSQGLPILSEIRFSGDDIVTPDEWLELSDWYAHFPTRIFDNENEFNSLLNTSWSKEQLAKDYQTIRSKAFSEWQDVLNKVSQWQK